MDGDLAMAIEGTTPRDEVKEEPEEFVIPEVPGNLCPPVTVQGSPEAWQGVEENEAALIHRTRRAPGEEQRGWSVALSPPPRTLAAAACRTALRRDLETRQRNMPKQAPGQRLLEVEENAGKLSLFQEYQKIFKRNLTADYEPLQKENCEDVIRKCKLKRSNFEKDIANGICCETEVTHALLSIREPTQEKDHLYVVIVVRPSVRHHTIRIIEEYIQERNHIRVQIVGRTSLN
ncbi:hypothetical protein NDU88_004990 [Pleurodeles waltl]|uniref:Uncharacterized protein n=1 Tax=Pleurodeles waltl TaxID=8319 RepID=A0AAV7L3I0_PLEWA|nr:hypothetical protein NDU88_004990 [Pleurodeles waltl]